MDKHTFVPADVMEIHPNCFALEVVGDCMEPTVKAGSVVLIDPDTMPPKDGSELGAVELDGYMYLCRPLRIMGQIVMFKDNKKYQNLTFRDTHARVVGAVVWVSDAVVQESSDELLAVGMA